MGHLRPFQCPPSADHFLPRLRQPVQVNAELHQANQQLLFAFPRHIEHQHEARHRGEAGKLASIVHLIFTRARMLQQPALLMIEPRAGEVSFKLLPRRDIADRLEGGKPIPAKLARLEDRFFRADIRGAKCVLGRLLGEAGQDCGGLQHQCRLLFTRPHQRLVKNRHRQRFIADRGDQRSIHREVERKTDR